MKRVRLLLGISVFWLALSLLFDGINTLLLPDHLLRVADPPRKATILGLITFAGLAAGMIVQPVAGTFSDRLRSRWGRTGAIGLGVLGIVASLGLLALTRSVLAYMVLGGLLGEGSVGAALAAMAGIVVGMFALTALLVREPKGEASRAAPARATLADAFRLDLRQHRTFAWLIASRFLFLLGTYAVGRFLVYFVADRLGLEPNRAAEESAALLGGLTLITALSGPLAGWLADRIGRLPLMVVGALLSMAGVLLLMISASSAWQMLLFGGLMALGSGAFATANWAMSADLAPAQEAARFLALANFGTAGAAAAAGLFGPLVDAANASSPGLGYTNLLIASALTFALSALALRGTVHARAELEAIQQVSS